MSRGVGGRGEAICQAEAVLPWNVLAWADRLAAGGGRRVAGAGEQAGAEGDRASEAAQDAAGQPSARPSTSSSQASSKARWCHAL